MSILSEQEDLIFSFVLHKQHSPVSRNSGMLSLSLSLSDDYGFSELNLTYLGDVVGPQQRRGANKEVILTLCRGQNGKMELEGLRRRHE